MANTGRGAMSGSFPNEKGAIDSLARGWGPLLEQWLRIVGHNAWRGSADCSWWYGERASVSQLAGAAWKLPGGWALQEYAGTRGDEAHGRIDLAVEADNGLRSAIEAKQIWPGLSRRGFDTEDLHRDVNAALLSAAAQLVRDGAPWIAEHDDYDLVSAVFVVPRVSPNEPERPARIATLLEAISTVPGTVAAWSFPRWAHDVVSQITGDLYPGVALVARCVRPRPSDL
ncbi:MAG: hypothetical protein M5U28_52875 [Sandaracinaceae bacterium]|nr:hypothetical protein [Sandaracinaceae bacterium]